MKRNIDIQGIEELDEKEKIRTIQLIEEYYPKIERQLKNVISLNIHIKIYDKGGKKKYSIQAKLKSSINAFESNASDWDFAKTIHKVMNKLQNEVEKRFHVSEQH